MTSTFSSHEFGDAPIADGFVAVEDVEIAKDAEEFVLFEKMHAVSGAAAEAGMKSCVGLIDQQATGFEGTQEFRENFSLKVEEDQYELVSCFRSFEFRSVGDAELYFVFVLASEFLRFVNSNIGDVEQGDAPIPFCEPDGMAAEASGEVERVAGLRKQRLDEVFECPHEKRIGSRRAVWANRVLVIPGLPLARH